jgi:outer membrane protein assembly factor BamB
MKSLFFLPSFAGLLLGLFTNSLVGDDWPQWLGQNRDGRWHETGIVESFPQNGPPRLWRADLAGGYAGPAVADGRVFVTDYVRIEGDPTPNPGKKSELTGRERVTCLDAESGAVVWRHEYDCNYKLSYPAGPRVTPTVNEGHVYTLGAEGNLICFEAASGKIVWKRDLKENYGMQLAPHWGFAAHPLVDGDTLYCVVGGAGSVAVAFDKKTGKEKWRALTASEPGYCPPTMIEAGGTRQLLIWHPESLNSLNPETGEVYWSFAMAPAYKMSIIAPVKSGDYLYACALQGTSILLKLGSEAPTAEEVWRGKGLHPDHNPPLIVDGYLYGIDEKGQLRCFDLQSGDKKWESLAAATNGRPANSTTGFIVKNGDRYFIATEQGELIMARMSPEGYQELGRFRMLEPTSQTGNRDVVWSHPAFANRCVFARNDREIVCYSLAE